MNLSLAEHIIQKFKIIPTRLRIWPENQLDCSQVETTDQINSNARNQHSLLAQTLFLEKDEIPGIASNYCIDFLAFLSVNKLFLKKRKKKKETRKKHEKHKITLLTFYMRLVCCYFKILV